MFSRGTRAFFIWSVLIVSLIAGRSSYARASNASNANASLSEPAPELKFEWIDDDGTVVPAEWQSVTAWAWNDQKLVLQIWFEVPSHLTETLPTQLTKKIAAPGTKAPFKQSPDHVLIIMQLQQPVELFRFEDGRNRFLKISTQATNTNWKRHPSCKEAAPSLEEVQNTGVGPFFISLTCRGRAGDDTAWVDVSTSAETTLEIEPLGKTKHKGNSVLVPLPTLKAQDRKLAILRFRDANGEMTAVYTLSANPVPTPTSTAPAPAVTETPIASPSVVEAKSKTPVIARLGLHAQFVESGEARDGLNRHGRATAEIAISHQTHMPRLSVDLELPVRRLGTGLDTGSPGDTFAWVYVGYKPTSDFSEAKSPEPPKRSVISLGVQASLLDARLDRKSALQIATRERERLSTVSISPALEWVYDHRHSLTLAPLDLRSQISTLRGRLLFPFAKDSRYALAIEGFGARSFGRGHDGWYASGFTLGFTGGF